MQGPRRIARRGCEGDGYGQLGQAGGTVHAYHCQPRHKVAGEVGVGRADAGVNYLQGPSERCAHLSSRIKLLCCAVHGITIGCARVGLNPPAVYR